MYLLGNRVLVLFFLGGPLLPWGFDPNRAEGVGEVPPREVLPMKYQPNWLVFQFFALFAAECGIPKLV